VFEGRLRPAEAEARRLARRAEARELFVRGLSPIVALSLPGAAGGSPTQTARRRSFPWDGGRAGRGARSPGRRPTG